MNSEHKHSIYWFAVTSDGLLGHCTKDHCKSTFTGKKFEDVFKIHGS